MQILVHVDFFVSFIVTTFQARRPNYLTCLKNP